MAIGEDGLHLRDPVGQDHDHGQSAIGGEGVAFIGAAADLAFDDAFAAHDFAQGGDDLRAPHNDGVDVHGFHRRLRWRRRSAPVLILARATLFVTMPGKAQALGRARLAFRRLRTPL